jgi:hypothetical protein
MWEMWKMEAGSLYLELRQLEDKDGNKLSLETARVMAAMGGMINAGIEELQFQSLIQRFAGGTTLASTLTPESIKKAFAAPTIANRFAKGAAAHVYGSFKESVQEGIQEEVQIIAGDFGKMWSNYTKGTNFEPATLAEHMDRTGEVFVKTLKGTIISSAPWTAAGAVNTHYTEAKVKVAEEKAAHLKELSKVEKQPGKDFRGVQQVEEERLNKVERAIAQNVSRTGWATPAPDPVVESTPADTKAAEALTPTPEQENKIVEEAKNPTPAEAAPVEEAAAETTGETTAQATEATPEAAPETTPAAKEVVDDSYEEIPTPEQEKANRKKTKEKLALDRAAAQQMHWATPEEQIIYAAETRAIRQVTLRELLAKTVFVPEESLIAYEQQVPGGLEKLGIKSTKDEKTGAITIDNADSVNREVRLDRTIYDTLAAHDVQFQKATEKGLRHGARGLTQAEGLRNFNSIVRDSRYALADDQSEDAIAAKRLAGAQMRQAVRAGAHPQHARALADIIARYALGMKRRLGDIITVEQAWRVAIEQYRKVRFDGVDVMNQANVIVSPQTDGTVKYIAVREMSWVTLAHLINGDPEVMPSIGVVPMTRPRTGYGPVTVIYDKSTVDPRANPDNKLYRGDAMTTDRNYVAHDMTDDQITDAYDYLNGKYPGLMIDRKLLQDLMGPVEPKDDRLMWFIAHGIDSTKLEAWIDAMGIDPSYKKNLHVAEGMVKGFLRMELLNRTKYEAVSRKSNDVRGEAAFNEAIESAKKEPLAKAGTEDEIHDLDEFDEARTKEDMQRHGKDLSESKPRRLVDKNEVKGIVYPKSTPQQVKDVINSLGIPTAEYDDGPAMDAQSLDSRAKAIQDVGNRLDEESGGQTLLQKLYQGIKGRAKITLDYKNAPNFYGYVDNMDEATFIEKQKSMLGKVRKFWAAREISSIRLSSLLRSPELGPSGGIVHDKNMTTGYGNVQIIYYRNAIDPAANKANKVYIGDGYTGYENFMKYDVEDQQVIDIVDFVAETYGLPESYSRPALVKAIKDSIAEGLERSIKKGEATTNDLNELINTLSNDPLVAFGVALENKWSYNPAGPVGEALQHEVAASLRHDILNNFALRAASDPTGMFTEEETLADMLGSADFVSMYPQNEIFDLEELDDKLRVANMGPFKKQGHKQPTNYRNRMYRELEEARTIDDGLGYIAETKPNRLVSTQEDVAGIVLPSNTPVNIMQAVVESGIPFTIYQNDSLTPGGKHSSVDRHEQYSKRMAALSLVQRLQNDMDTGTMSSTRGPVYWQSVGVHSKTINWDKYNTAVERWNNGEDADSIYNDTGFWVGKDGKWRYEIADYLNKVDLSPFIKKGGKFLNYSKKAKLSDIYDNQELYDAYPMLKDVVVDIRKRERNVKKESYMGLAGWEWGYKRGDPGHFGITVFVDSLHPTEINERENQKTIIHEVQHTIQDLERFAKGGPDSVSYAFDVGGFGWDRLKAWEDYIQKTENRKVTSEEIAAAKEEIATEIYWNLAGEIEARRTEDRAAMGARLREEAGLPNMDMTTEEHRKYDFIYGSYEEQLERREAPFLALQDESDPRKPPVARKEGKITVTAPSLGQRPVDQTADSEAFRGRIIFDDKLRKGMDALIQLSKEQDATTMFHEMGHKVLMDFLNFGDLIQDKNNEYWKDGEIIFDYLNTSRDAFRQLTNRLNELNRQANETGLSGLEQEEFDLLKWKSSQMHEKFAKTWETYLATGVAPSLELEPVFARLRQWFIEVYHNLQEALGVELTPEVRGVFDRLLASQPEMTEVMEARLTMGDLALEDATVREAIRTAQEEQRGVQERQAAYAEQDGQFVFDSDPSAVADVEGHLQSLEDDATYKDTQTERKGILKRAMQAGSLNPNELIEEFGREVAQDIVNKVKKAMGSKFFKAGGVSLQQMGDTVNMSREDFVSLLDKFDPEDRPQTPLLAITESVFNELQTQIGLDKAGKYLAKRYAYVKSIYDAMMKVNETGDVDVETRELLESSAREMFDIERLADAAKMPIKNPSTLTEADVIAEPKTMTTLEAMQKGYDMAEKYTAKAFKEGVKEGRLTEKTRQEKIRAEEKQNLRDQRDMARAKGKQNVWDEKARVAALEEAQKQRNILKREMRDKIKKINRMGESENIIWSVQKKIQDYLSRYDLKRRSQETVDQRARIEEWLTEEAAGSEAFTGDDLKYVGVETLNTMSIADIRALYDEVAAMYDQGRVEFDAWEAAHRERQDKIAAEMTNDLMRKESNAPEIRTRREDNTKQYKGITGVLAKTKDTFYAMTLNMQRLNNWLGGGDTEYQDSFSRHVTDPINAAMDTELTHRTRRQENVIGGAEKLGVTARELAKPVDTIRGHVFTVDEVIDLYNGIKNPRKQQAILNGLLHRTPFRGSEAQKVINSLIAKLTPEQKKAGDLIVQDHSDNVDRIERAFIDTYNRGYSREPDYTSIHRMGLAGAEGLFAADDPVILTGGERNNQINWKVADNFTKDRMDIKPENQKDIQVGAFRNWFQDMEMQEHAAAFADVAKTLYSVLTIKNPATDETIAQMIRERFGDEVWQSFAHFVNLSVRDDTRLANDVLNGISGFLGKNMAVSYLAANPAVWLSQWTSIPRFRSFAGYEHILGAIAEAIQGGEQFMEEVYKLDPQMRNRKGGILLNAIQRQIREKHNSYNDAMQLIMQPISTQDRIVAAIGWKAVYNASVRALGHDGAVRRAQRAVAMTQQPIHQKDIPRLWNQKAGIMRLALIFTSDSSNRLSMSTYDMVQRITHGDGRQAFNTASALMMGAVLFKLAKDGPPWRRDDDDLDGERVQGIMEWFASAVGRDVLTSIPIIGNDMLAAVDKWKGKYYKPTTNAYFMPIFRLWEAAMTFRKAQEKGWTDERLGEIAFDLIEAGSLSGLMPAPVTGIRRGVDAIGYIMDNDYVNAALRVVGVKVIKRIEEEEKRGGRKPRSEKRKPRDTGRKRR